MRPDGSARSLATPEGAATGVPTSRPGFLLTDGRLLRSYIEQPAASSPTAALMTDGTRTPARPGNSDHDRRGPGADTTRHGAASRRRSRADKPAPEAPRQERLHQGRRFSPQAGGAKAPPLSAHRARDRREDTAHL